MSIAAARPLATVASLGGDGNGAQLAIPAVMLAPIRPDVVRYVHTNIAKNARQAYAVNAEAGMQHSAESWGTGRAVARVPRVSGGGTSRAGQSAFTNQSRKGRMFAPTKQWRKWHRKVAVNQRRYAVVSAIAASALQALVKARGHKIDNVPEVPLVVPDSVESITTTKKMVEALKAVGAYDDVEKAKRSKKMRAGKGKMRGRRWTRRRGPLIVYSQDNGIRKAARNLPGVELADVERLNLLQLAPGGHLGRFVIWTQSAFARLDSIFGTRRAESSQKSGYRLPAAMMTNSDITRIINSDEVQSKVRPAIRRVQRAVLKKNPLRNLGALVRLNPFALNQRRAELLASTRRAKARAAEEKARREGQAVKKDAAQASKDAAAKAHRSNQKATYARITADDSQ